MDFGDLQELQAAYRNEAADLLADLGDALLLLEHDPQNMDVINRVFRAMHTLKGSGASAGFRRLANFVHHVEDVFNRIRNRQMETTPVLIDAALKACDCCAMLLELGGTESDTPLPLETEVLEAIRPFLPEESFAAKNKNSKASVKVRSRYRIGFQPNREIFFSGTDPASLLLELTDLGTLQVTCDGSALLSAEEFDPEQCYLQWQAVLETDKPEEAVRGVFQFVEDDCAVSIVREELAATAVPDGKDTRFRAAAGQCFVALGYAMEQCREGQEKQGAAAARRAAQTLLSASKAQGHSEAAEAALAILEELETIGQGAGVDSAWLLRMNESIDAARGAVDLASAVGRAEKVADEAAKSVEGTSKAAAADGKASEAAPAAEASGLVAQSIRVDSVKLDALMRLAGELLVARGALPAFAERVERGEPPKVVAKEMRDAGAKISRLADDLQATVMSIRMLPVRQVFQRFPRLVRDIARNLDKEIDLQVSGEETELDKTVIDSIGDPLTHIIRNAADHGIESTADRLAAGKPALGRIHLSACMRGSNVNIEVRDDGKGLDAEKLKRRAVEKGVHTEAAVAAMDEQAAFKIILAAGFSTVDKVTDLSGRGVGMDVVRNSVELLNGAIHIESEKGKGTCFRIELPASLLVSKGILVSVAGQQLILLMNSIRNMVKVSASLLRTVGGQRILAVRGTVFPVLSLAQALSFGWNEDSEAEIAVAIVDSVSGGYGLIVDRFLGEAEVVVKPLSGVLAQVPEYVGAAIMGDGRTVLVVNTDRLLALQQTARPVPQARGTRLRQ